MLRVRWSLIGAACCLPLTSQPPVIFGVYGSPHSHDAIHIVRKANDKVNLNLKLYYANGHTCQLDHEGEWRSDHLLVLTDGLKENEPCRLEVSFAKGRITLKDPGQRCAQVYCGTRGKLDGVSLRKR